MRCIEKKAIFATIKEDRTNEFTEYSIAKHKTGTARYT
jgi:hypothetical protein